MKLRILTVLFTKKKKKKKKMDTAHSTVTAVFHNETKPVITSKYLQTRVYQLLIDGIAIFLVQENSSNDVLRDDLFLKTLNYLLDVLKKNTITTLITKEQKKNERI